VEGRKIDGKNRSVYAGARDSVEPRVGTRGL